MKQRKRGRIADNLHDIGNIPKTESEGISKDEVQEKYTAMLESKNDLAVPYKEQARYQDAEKLLIEALKGRRLKLGDTHPHTLESWNSLIDLYEAYGKPLDSSGSYHSNHMSPYGSATSNDSSCHKQLVNRW